MLYQSYDLPPGSESWGGETLAECISEWEIFSEKLDISSQNNLLDEIRNYDPKDGDIASSDLWEAKSRNWAVTPTNHIWPWFADHLKHFRRFIIEDDPTGEIIRPENWVPDALKDGYAIREIKTTTPMFRGRLGCINERTPLPANEMGAPGRNC